MGAEYRRRSLSSGLGETREDVGVLTRLGQSEPGEPTVVPVVLREKCCGENDESHEEIEDQNGRSKDSETVPPTGPKRSGYDNFSISFKIFSGFILPIRTKITRTIAGYFLGDIR
jgi:hypothetical protein